MAALTPEQEEFVRKLVEMQETGDYESEVFFVGTFTGWSAILGGRGGKPGIEIPAVSDANLVAIASGGLMTLMPRGQGQYSGVLSPNAFDSYGGGGRGGGGYGSVEEYEEAVLGTLADFRRDLDEEVFKRFRKGDEAAGEEFFDRWAARLVNFLNEISEGEAQRFIEKIRAGRTIFLADRSPLEKFMISRGGKAVAYLEGLEKEVRRGGFLTLPTLEEQPSGGRERESGHEGKEESTVYVVHGRNVRVRDAMFAFLRALGLKPLEWSEATAMTGDAAPYVGQIVERAFEVAKAVVVLFTPDDDAKLRQELWGPDEPEFEKTLTPQARPNVLFEAGMALGRHPKATILVEVGSTRPFSDIAGRHLVRFNGDHQSRNRLANRLEGAGCRINRRGDDWLTVGDFGA